VAYVADLNSKNGTTLNGVALRQTPAPLQGGDVIRFGGKLSYRLRMVSRAAPREHATRAVYVTLKPARGDLGLQPIEVTQFPFLVSKADETFARYSVQYPHQVNYVSRRHAHIFLKGGVPFVEDLGSTNGTFLDDKRLDEAAVPLQDGVSLAFGGKHFVYTVSLAHDVDAHPTATAAGPCAPPTGPVPEELADIDRTTFVTTAHSFLDIFCVDQDQPRDDEINSETLPNHAAPGRRSSSLLGHFVPAFGPRALLYGVVLIAAIVAASSALYFKGATERNFRTLAANGDYRGAESAANAYLKTHPGDAAATALATDSLLKAYVPDWIRRLRQRDVAGADSLVAQMTALSANNADARFLVDELGWTGRLEALMTTPGREGPDAPIRIYADEAPMSALLKEWRSDPAAHQRRLDRIASIVTEFRDLYAVALSHLRKLDSDDSVYLAAIERLKASVAKALEQDDPESLNGEIADYADKYARLTGLDKLQDDLRQYLALDRALRARDLGALVTAMQTAHFTTPQFQARYRELQANRLPPPELTQRYMAASAAWKNGQATQAIAELKGMASGPWSDASTVEIHHKQQVTSQFEDLQKTRRAPGFDDRIMSFYESLDPAADVWFVNALQPDVGTLKPKALARAEQWLTQAQAAWTQYRTNGAIGGEERLEKGISATFRKKAGLLADALADAQHAVQLFHQFKADRATQAETLAAQIQAETNLQRRSLLELRPVLEPGLLDAKLALIGADKGTNGEERRTP
jgi:pSer/pThr/pTyr-binding forkhead associated (FHA) protein